MNDSDKFFVIAFFICVILLIYSNGRDLTHIREHVHEIIENQKSSVVTPTPQKDVE